jgi:hypothetical protein
MSDCEATGVSPGYPLNTIDYGGANGISLEQTVNGLVPGATYVLEFWAGGETIGGVFPELGLFGVDIGFGYTYLRCKPTEAFTGVGLRYIIVFNATAVSHSIKFTNWGHICNDCTELVLDDVRLYTLAELSPAVPPCAGANVTAMFTAPNHICPGTCTDFVNLSVNATSYQWSFPGGNPSSSTDASPTGICYNSPGTYGVTLIVSNGISGDTLTLNNYMTVYPFPPPQGIQQSGDTLIANAGAVSYQWYFGGTLIPGATDNFYVATQSGNYNVVATDDNDCEVEAAILNVIAGLDKLAPNIFRNNNNHLGIFPNPALEQIIINSKEFIGKPIQIIIQNIHGSEVHRMKINDCQLQVEVPIRKLSPGAYCIEVIFEEKIYRNKFMKIE